MSFLREIVRITQGWGWAAITLRLAIAAVVGILIGLNRELKNRSAGIKTHVLVCVGSALATMTSEYVSIAFPGQGDINRIGAQVISGVGFLGVGTIITAFFMGPLIAFFNRRVAESMLYGRDGQRDSHAKNEL